MPPKSSENDRAYFGPPTSGVDEANRNAHTDPDSLSFRLPSTCNCPQTCFLHFSKSQRLSLLQRWGQLEGLRLRLNGSYSSSGLCIATVTDSDSHSMTSSPQGKAILRRRVAEAMSTSIKVVSAFSEKAATLASRGWSAETLSCATPWAPPVDIHDFDAAAEVWSGPRITHIIARLLYSRATIRLEPNDLKPTPDFLTALKSALEQQTTQSQAQQLYDVLNRWGHVIPLEFQIGGALFASTRVFVSSPSELLDKEEELKTRLSTELLFSGTQGTPGQRTPMFRIGGDLVNHVNHADWLESLKFSTHWQIIEINAATSPLKLLDDASLQQVRSNSALQKMYASTHSISPAPLYHFPSQLRTGGYIESPLPPQFNPDSEFSISAFVRWPDAVGPAQWRGMFSLKVPSFRNHVVWVGLGSSTRCPQVVVTLRSQRHVHFDPCLSEIRQNVWTHITLSHLKVGPTGRSLVIYLGGKRERSFDLDEPFLVGEKMSLLQGCGYWGGNPDFFFSGGQIASVKIFDRALTEADLLAEANSPERENLSS